MESLACLGAVFFFPKIYRGGSFSIFFENSASLLLLFWKVCIAVRTFLCVCYASRPRSPSAWFGWINGIWSLIVFLSLRLVPVSPATIAGRRRFYLVWLHIWLILPVVICSSQRLSHAGLSTNGKKWNCKRLIKSVLVYLIVLYSG